MVAGAQGHADAGLVDALIQWFDGHERPLPWRRTTPWGVLVSEVMLQQTPVERVLPAWHAWLDRWPSPAALATTSVAEALRAWGRLGYPRRAVRLHECARIIVTEHAGQVPDDLESLRALPGVGEYTAAAVLAFAFGRRAIVLDTNVRRVLSRTVGGKAAPTSHLTVAERARADALWPQADARSARWSAAVMEFGALVCTARAPGCDGCPVRDGCAWITLGRPGSDNRRRRQPEYLGSDRQARGRIMAVLRDAPGPVAARTVEACWLDAEQRERALAGLLDDGLIVRIARRGYALPS